MRLLSESNSAGFIPPSTEEWARLYAAAIRVRDLKPWEWMEEDNVFGVENPETGEIGYVCVLGWAGEFYAINLYLGNAGLHGFLEMREVSPFDLSADPGEMLLLQDCLAVAFSSRHEQQKRDLDVVKSLKLKSRGANAWPEFRRYKPGYLPHFITRSEARFLTLALEQTVDVAARFGEDNRLLPRATKSSAYLVRVPDSVSNGGSRSMTWRDERHKLARVPKPKPIQAAELPDDLRAEAERMAKLLPRTQAQLELDFTLMMGAIPGDPADDERPYVPHVILILDARTGAIMNTEFCAPTELDRKLPEALLALLAHVNETGALPVRIQVSREETFRRLQPYAKLLEVDIEQSDDLPAFEAAQESLSDMSMIF